MSKVITGPKTRFSYANVFTAKANSNGELKYSVSLIIPKSDKDTLQKISAAMKEAYAEGKDRLGMGAPTYEALKKPLRDGDAERPGDPAYANAYFINANSNQKPGVVDKDCNPIMDQSEFYSGCYGRASINFFTYNSKGNKGIGCGLNHVQKLKDGEALGGRASAESDFADFSYEEEVIDEF